MSLNSICYTVIIYFQIRDALYSTVTILMYKIVLIFTVRFRENTKCSGNKTDNVA